MKSVREACQLQPKALGGPLFIARHIEKAGTGTLDMIALFREAGVPEPDFRQDGGMFVQIQQRRTTEMA